MNFEYLSNKYQLSKTEEAILKYLHDNIDDLKKIGIRKVAKDNYTSTTTVYKLCKKLKYDGYSDMIYKISYDFKEDNTNNPIDIYTNTNYQIEANLDQFSQLLSKYKNKLIMLVSVGISQTISNYINERLSINGFRSIANAHLQILTPENKDEVLVIAISSSGETKSLIDVLEVAKNNDIDIISFVGNSSSTIAKMSTLPIVISGKDQFLGIKNPPNTFYSELILVFECFINNIDIK